MHIRNSSIKDFAGRSRILLLIFILLTLCAGCASLNTSSELEKKELFWPSAPFDPKIQWVKGIHNRNDAGVEKSFWRKVVDFVAGEETDGISKPYGVYADAEERVFVADSAQGVVHQFNLKEKEYSLIGGGEKRVFRVPIAITGDDVGNLYITDSAAATVFRYNIRDKILTPFLAGTIEKPTGIAFNSKKRLLYISDTANHQIFVYDLHGRERTRIGRRGDRAGQLNFPTDIFIDSAGDLYVTDALNARIQIFSAEGKFLAMFGSAGDTAGYFAKPKGVAVDSEGHIYVSDAMQDSVQVFNRKGVLMLDFGEKGSGPGQFWMPSGVFIDKNDTIYVGDAYNQRVQIFKYLKNREEKSAVPGRK
ncbi:MAG: 6-bladed beta-propeller [Desulfuromonadaceae bacterium]|nr:6-bladed beta-propeller [Desulfuromonadaceae bacterium]MDD5106950.1 6-bladed beta-propeller [Desulfuromonadaceae bacterium]